MQLVWKSYEINKPEINLISDLRHTIINFYITESPDEYIIKLGIILYRVLQREICPPTACSADLFMGIRFVLDSSMNDKIYRIYRKEKTIPIKLTPVKTLDEWFTNLPLIQKIDLYNNFTRILAENLR